MLKLTPEKAFIFRITHIENVPWLLANGIHSRNSGLCDPNFREIGNPDLIRKRTSREVPVLPGGTLSDYVPFYFTPHSPMLLNIKTGYNGTRQTPMSEIVILVTTLHHVTAQGIPFVFTDRHAYLQAAEFKSDLADLELINWKILQARDFKRDPNDPSKVERYQAEALIYRHLPTSTLQGLACYGPQVEVRLQQMVQAAGMALKIESLPGWYF